MVSRKPLLQGGGKRVQIYNPRFHYQMLELPDFGECYFRPLSTSAETYPLDILSYPHVQAAVHSGALQIKFIHPNLHTDFQEGDRHG